MESKNSFLPEANCEPTHFGKPGREVVEGFLCLFTSTGENGTGTKTY